MTEHRQDSSAHRTSLWAIGWAGFASVMMVMAGFWWIVSGLVAIIDQEFLEVNAAYILQLDPVVWGWIHLALGLLTFAAGFALTREAPWARAFTGIVAVLAAVAAFGWLPYYPVWGVLQIAVSIVVLWAVNAYAE